MYWGVGVVSVLRTVKIVLLYRATMLDAPV